MAPPLPHAGLMHDYEVHPSGGPMLAALGSPAWDPARTVLLEAEPKPAPDRDGRGTVTIIDRSVDHLTVDAELDAPAILLVTDAWGDGWRARPVDPADDQRYEVMPVNPSCARCHCRLGGSVFGWNTYPRTSARA